VDAGDAGSDIGTSKIGRVHKAGNGWIVYFGITSEGRYRRSTTGVGLAPDLSDPATGGCLLTLLGVGWAAQQFEEDWQVWGGLCGEFFRGASLGEACALAMVAVDEVVALDAVP